MAEATETKPEVKTEPKVKKAKTVVAEAPTAPANIVFERPARTIVIEAKPESKKTRFISERTRAEMEAGAAALNRHKA